MTLVLDAYYPEFIGTAHCLNAPALFVHLWSIVSPWLSAPVRLRVSTVDAEHTPATIARVAALDDLPRIYGGSCDRMPHDVQAALGLDAKTAKVRAIYDFKGE